MENAITISFEAGTEGIRLFFDRSISCTKGTSGKRCEMVVFDGFAPLAIDHGIRARTCPRITMCESDPGLMLVPMHRAGPRHCAALVRAWIGGRHVSKLGVGCRSSLTSPYECIRRRSPTQRSWR